MEDRIDEGALKGSINSITIKKTELILRQMKTSICKISGKLIGTGFFCNINLEGKDTQCLITNFHVLDEQFIKINKKFAISLNDNSIYEELLINEKDILYLSGRNEYDIIIIKLKIKLNYVNYLQLDDYLFNNNSEKGYSEQSIYILHYPNGSEASVSFGYGLSYNDEYNISHKCNTQMGSSGAPILNLLTNKVIGIHKAFLPLKIYNIGTLLKYPLNILKNGNNPNIISKNSEIVSNNKMNLRLLTQKDYNEIYMRGIGIINPGNTCYINSCLQALIHCKLFIHSFFRMYNKIDVKTTPISYNFLEICISMLDIGDLINERYIDISYFRNVFYKMHSTFNNYNQNNSQDFCQVFLEDLNEELKEIKNIKFHRSFAFNPNKTKKVEDRQFNFRMNEKENSIISDLFNLQIININKCNCGYEVYSFQKFLSLSLSIPENIQIVDIKELLSIHFKTEYTKEAFFCTKCNRIEPHKNEIKISRPPEILIINLSRLNKTTQKKNECLITFPEILNLYDYIDHDLEFDKESNYQLFSIINHQGNINGGHYYTYIKPLKSKNWFEFNDSNVRQIIVNVKTIFPQTFSLFYIKQKYERN